MRFVALLVMMSVSFGLSGAATAAPLPGADARDSSSVGSRHDESPGSRDRAQIQVGGGLDCAVNPNWPDPYWPYCTSTRPAYTSIINLRVRTPSPSYTYSWSVSGAPLPSWCDSTTSTCQIVVDTRGVDQFVTATVVVSDGVQSATHTAYAHAHSACRGPEGIEFC